MTIIRPIKYPDDYDTLMGWWAKRGQVALQQAIFPGTGAVVEHEGVPVAMSFLYLDVGGAFSMIEWTSTNPDFVFSHVLLGAVKSLYAHLEEVAREKGCIIITSMVAPNSGEQRIMAKMGYKSQTDGEPSHVMYAKAITEAIPCQR